MFPGCIGLNTLKWLSTVQITSSVPTGLLIANSFFFVSELSRFIRLSVNGSLSRHATTDVLIIFYVQTILMLWLFYQYISIIFSRSRLEYDVYRKVFGATSFSRKRRTERRGPTRDHRKARPYVSDLQTCSKIDLAVPMSTAKIMVL